jgi:hypothetical protein
MPFEAVVTLIANVALALSLVVAVVFGIAQVRSAARDRKERLTLETIRTFQTREFAEVMLRLRNIKPLTSQEDMESLPESDQVILTQGAQMMESLGLLVHDGLIDLDLVDKTLGDYVANVWYKYKDFFLAMRERIPDPYLGEYFQWLAERVEEKMKENRKPYYL